MELATRSELRWALVRTMAVVTSVVVAFAAFASKIGSEGRDAWFSSLMKPGFIPSPAAFTLWWSLAFLLLGLALAIVLEARGAKGRRLALVALVLTFLLGLAWTPVTLGMRQLMAGTFIGLGALVSALVALALSLKVRVSASLLTLIVAGWIGYCTFGAWTLWQNNGSTPTYRPVESGTTQPLMP
jgi:translocator protein